MNNLFRLTGKTNNKNIFFSDIINLLNAATAILYSYYI